MQTTGGKSKPTSEITMRNIHFRGFTYVIFLRTKTGVVKITNCTFENISKWVIHIEYVERATQEDIEVEMYNSTVRNCSLFMKVVPIDNLLVTIIRSSFIGSPSEPGTSLRGFHIRKGPKNKHNFVINDTEFFLIQNVIYTEVIKVGGSQVNLSFSNCIFRDNGGKKVVSIIQIANTTAKFINITLINNTGLSGGAIYASSSNLQFDSCTFENNRALQSGGAVYLQHSTSHFNHCSFLHNIVETKNIGIMSDDISETTRNGLGTPFGVGGAIVSVGVSDQCKGTTSFNLCNFKGHKAPVSGGTIFQTGDNNRLKLYNSQIVSEGKLKTINFGKALVSYSPTYMNNVTMNTTKAHYPGTTLMTFRDLNGNATLMTHNISLNCLRGQKVILTGQFDRHRRNFSSLAVVCSLCPGCPVDYYSVYFGAVTLNETASEGYHIRQIKCHPCPFGGRCEKGIVRSAKNFWGYVTDEGTKIKFHVCPSGYCCNGKHCLKYNSCSKGRKGILCGQCLEGMTEDLVSSRCLPFYLCKNNWYYLLAITAGIGYLMFFIYISEIGRILVRFLDVRCKNAKGRKLIDNQPTEWKAFDNSDDFKEYLSVNSTKAAVDKYCFKGLIKSMFFFYQAKHLFPIYQENYDSDSVIGVIQKKISQVFNLNSDVLFPKGSPAWCPIPGMSSVIKSYVKLSFISLIVLLMVIIYFAVPFLYNFYCTLKGRQLKQCKSMKTNSSTQVDNFASRWKTRILCAALDFILLCYAALTKTLLLSLNCVSLGHFGKVLFLQGNIKCYQPWQYAIIGIVILWVLPFPFAITTASNLLEQKKISLRTFFASLILPGPYIAKWVISFRGGLFKPNPNQSTVSLGCGDPYHDESFGYHLIGTGQSNQDEGDIETTIRILTTLDGPFKKKSIISSNCFETKWESILIGRRLILILLNTFVFNALIQTIVTLVALFVFLTHHIWVMPFKSRLLNALEIFFLSSLCISSMVSIFPAYHYTYSMKTPELFEPLSRGFKLIETIISLAVPTVAVVMSTLLLLTKMFILFAKIPKLIWKFCKYRLSLCR